ncbi:PIN domain-containing protein [Negativicoccus succinicivorans]|uniref:PIN/TRAM domain-containing protein n=1 Tax=Negativicoccus succinicivorans TaxID=620903 RepID=UPI0028D0409C|nr:PIN domain-containing protein [Negativicoccus succinicivorans]
MIEKLLRFLFIGLFIILGVVLANQLHPYLADSAFFGIAFWQWGVFGVTLLWLCTILLGAFLGYVVGSVAAPYLFRKLRAFTAWGERTITGISSLDLILGIVGLFIGLIIANLLGLAFNNLPLIGPYIPIVLSIVLGYTGIYLAIGQKNQLSTIIANWRQGREKEPKETKLGPYGKILDTSVIIDGRIADIAKTGFLEGPLIVPVFVLEELQYIADSSDVLKRNRGRRGLDILNEMQKRKIIDVKIVTEDFDEQSEVDAKLVQLGLAHQATVITNDYNLNKVAELQGVHVLNINDLANAVKPVVIPGEQLLVQIVKQGKEEGQGVAYLDDGTMIVIENGKLQIGNNVFVVVTSVLQTSAGKMIFARYEAQQGGS